MTKTFLTPIHPGEILLEEFLKPMGITQYRLAKEIGVPAQRIGDVVLGKRRTEARLAWGVLANRCTREPPADDDTPEPMNETPEEEA